VGRQSPATVKERARERKSSIEGGGRAQ